MVVLVVQRVEGARQLLLVTAEVNNAMLVALVVEQAEPSAAHSDL